MLMTVTPLNEGKFKDTFSKINQAAYNAINKFNKIKNGEFGNDYSTKGTEKDIPKIIPKQDKQFIKINGIDPRAGYISITFDGRKVSNRLANMLDPNNKEKRKNNLYDYITDYEDHMVTMELPMDLKYQKSSSSSNTNTQETKKAESVSWDDDDWDLDEDDEEYENVLFDEIGDRLKMNESLPTNTYDILSMIFSRYPDISEEDEDYLNSLSYDELVSEVRNRGWDLEESIMTEDVITNPNISTELLEVLFEECDISYGRPSRDAIEATDVWLPWDSYEEFNEDDYYDNYGVSENEFYETKDYFLDLVYRAKYYKDSNVMYLQLHDHSTLVDIDNYDLPEAAYFELVNEAADAFTEKTGESVYFLGRSGRHVCVNLDLDNLKDYNDLVELALEAEESVINQANEYGLEESVMVPTPTPYKSKNRQSKDEELELDVEEDDSTSDKFSYRVTYKDNDTADYEEKIVVAKDAEEAIKNFKEEMPGKFIAQVTNDSFTDPQVYYQDGWSEVREESHLKEDFNGWDDDNQVWDHRYVEIATKQVQDSDDFWTDYTWYYDRDEDRHLFIFGDKDKYGPDFDYADFECDSDEEAQDWFDHYGEDDLDEELELKEVDSESLELKVDEDEVLTETPGLTLSTPEVNYADGRDEEGISLDIEINGKNYHYVMKHEAGEEGKTPADVARTVKKMQKFSDGKALAYLKKNMIAVKDESLGESYKVHIDYGFQERTLDYPDKETAQKKVDQVNELKKQPYLKGLEVWMDEDEPLDEAWGDEYFGKTEADKYGDMIQDKCAGMKISKRVADKDKPYGLPKVAEKLGIDMWDLLDALEGMCHQERAIEIDDSTYKIKAKTTKVEEESTDLSQEALDACLRDYRENAFGFDGIKDYVETNYPFHSQEFRDKVTDYLKSNLNESTDLTNTDTEVIKTINDVYKNRGEIESDDAVKDIMSDLENKNISVDADYLSDMIVKSVEMIDQLDESVNLKEDYILHPGRKFKTKSGHTLKITDVVTSLSEFDGHPIIEIEYHYETTDGASGSSYCSAQDFYDMLQESIKVGDRVSHVDDQEPRQTGIVQDIKDGVAKVSFLYKGNEEVVDTPVDKLQREWTQVSNIGQHKVDAMDMVEDTDETLKEEVTYTIGYDAGDNFSKTVKVKANSLADAMKEFKEKNPDKEITSIFEEGLKEEKKSGNSFKDYHICQGCGNPLSKCTCKVEGLEESIEGGSRINFDDDIVKVYHNGKEVYKGLEDDEPMKREDWVWDYNNNYYTLDDRKGGQYIKVCLESKER